MSFFDWFRKRASRPEPLPAYFPPATPLPEVWRRIIQEETKSWVLFAQGTCVILMEGQTGLRAQAVDLLRRWGPVQVGTPAGDFNVIHLDAHPGWVVTCHHPDILTYVSPEELPGDGGNDLAIGLYGRSKRDRDASELEVVHVEDKRRG